MKRSFFLSSSLALLVVVVILAGALLTPLSRPALGVMPVYEDCAFCIGLWPCYKGGCCCVECGGDWCGCRAGCWDCSSHGVSGRFATLCPGGPGERY